ncbi:MAG: hypothetical protein ACREOJ_14165 [Gemmatimonadaceae bacterium]
MEPAATVAQLPVEAFAPEVVSQAPVEPEPATLESFEAPPRDSEFSAAQPPVRLPWTAPVLEAVEASTPESAPVMQVEAQAEPEVEARVEPQAEAQAEPQADIRAEVEAEVESDVGAAVEAEAAPETQPEANAAATAAPWTVVAPEAAATPATAPGRDFSETVEPFEDTGFSAFPAVAAAPADELNDALACPDLSATTTAEPDDPPAVAPDQALAGIAEELHDSAAPWAQPAETEYENDPWSRTALAEMFPDPRAIVAASLERIAQRIRDGDVSISRDASSSTDAGALAAVLAALLRETAHR